MWELTEAVVRSIPGWLIGAIIILILVIIFIILFKGIYLSFKGLKLDTTQHPEDIQELSIPVAHLIQFRKLRHDMKEDILVIKGEFKAHFTSKFRDFLIDKGLDDTNNKSSDYTRDYAKTLGHALDTVFDPMIKKVIFGNHFPVREENESEKDYEDRFYEKLTKPNTLTIMKMTKGAVAAEWDFKLSRTDFEENYVMSTENIDEILQKSSSTLIKIRSRRDHVFEQIQNQDETSIEMLKFEWEMVYG